VTTECNQQSFRFHRAGRREVVARFDGGYISSDGGGVLPREVERHGRIVEQFAACFTDHRDANRIEHPLSHLVGQRVFGLALGYEDLNDHDTLRCDPMLALMVGDDDPTGRQQQAEATKQAARVFAELRYRTKKSWSKERRVIAKAEHLPAPTTSESASDKANARFIVTNLTPDDGDARSLYEEIYCARGDMENRIKEQQLCLFADRLSCEDLRANQIRLYFSTVAYTLLAALRRRALKNTELEHAQASTIRVRLLKIGVRLVVTARKVWLSVTVRQSTSVTESVMWSCC